MPHRAGLILGQIPHCTLTRVKCPGIARGGGGVGGFGIDWYITPSKPFNSVICYFVQGHPQVELRMSNNTVHVRTCSDSCSALLQLIQYIAADGDLVPSYEPEEPDASKAPSVSEVTHSQTVNCIVRSRNWKQYKYLATLTLFS